MNARDFVSRLGAAGKPSKTSTGWQCRCPAHEDGKASLSVADADNGKTLIHCHAGCNNEAVVAAVGLKMSDLFPVKVKPPASQPRQIVATYDYTDELGTLISQAVRYKPKDFSQRRPDASNPGGWIWSVKGVRAVPYRLPEVIAAVAFGKPVFICEGEKDCNAMYLSGLVATCNIGGALKWPSEISAHFLGAVVCIVADKDKTGRKHAQGVATHLHKVATRVCVIELPDVGDTKVKDAADYLDAGGSAAGIVTIAADAPEWTPQAAPVELLATPKQATPGQVAQSADDNAPKVADHFKNDIGYADAFVNHHAGSIRFCADEKLWIVFDGEHGWQRDTTGRIMALAADYARERYQWALKVPVLMDLDAGKRIITSMISLGNRKRIEPMLSFALCSPSIVVRSEQLDADPFLVGVGNGVINIRDGSFQPHCREHLVTRRLAVRFDAAATAPTWERFLTDVQPDSEMRSFLQRLSGYGLTGEIRDHVLPFHYGVGANGKGTFLEHALLKLAGTYGAKLTDSLVYASDRGHLPHLELANLCGRRFALGEENAESGKLNESLLKSITGGDRQKGRFHYGNFVEYFPTYKIALVGNHKPRIDGTDDGIWRRFLLVDWPVKIPTGRRDVLLKDKLAAEMPGILNWCIAGARAWFADGLNPPESCKAATEAFRQGSDKLAEFLTEHVEADAEAYCTKADVFTAYQRWAGQQGITRPMSKRSLGFQLVNRGWQEFQSGHENSRCWAGWRIKHQFKE